MASRYRLLDRIAVGATAEVFRAVAVDDGEKPVVIKRVLPQRANDPRFKKMFQTEAALIAQLSHRGIVKLLDFGEMNGTCFLALEPVDGVDLATLLADGPLPPPLCAWIGTQLAAALGAAHARGVVHRDVSTRNVLASVDGEVKLVDFGIARGEVDYVPTDAAGWQGTLATVAPEQLLGTPIDGRTDIYAIGAVLCECALGRPPFVGATFEETIDRIEAGNIDLPRDALGADHGPLVDVMRRCLARAREDRFRDAAELECALEDILATRLVPVGAPELAARVRTARSRARAQTIDKVAQELLNDGGFTMERTAIQRDLPVAAPASSRSVARTPAASKRPWIPTIIAASLASTAAVLVTLALIDRDEKVIVVETLPPSPLVQSAPVDVEELEPKPVAAAAPAQPAQPAEPVEPVRAKTVIVQTGMLTVNSIPWAKVYVDGRYVGDTPLTKARVAVGKHRLTLRDESGRVIREMTASIEHNTERKLSFELGK